MKDMIKVAIAAVSGAPIGSSKTSAASALEALLASPVPAGNCGYLSEQFETRWSESPVIEASYGEGQGQEPEFHAVAGPLAVMLRGGCSFGSVIRVDGFINPENKDVFVDVFVGTCGGHSVAYSVMIAKGRTVVFSITPDAGPSQNCWADGEEPDIEARKATTVASVEDALSPEQLAYAEKRRSSEMIRDFMGW
jgi:hypothetical protein